MRASGNLIGLLGALSILATFAFSAADRASAAFSTVDRTSAEDADNTFSLQCHPESGVWYVSDGYFRNWMSDIPCDEAKPGWVFDWNNFGEVLFLYDGDHAPTPVLKPDGTQIGTTVRKVHEQGTKRPPVNQPLAVGTNPVPFTYNADANNRAVRGADGNCYREQKLTNGKWKRSGSYGSSDEACRRASWNAYYRSQRGTLLNPVSGTFPGGTPPAAGN